MNQRCVHCLRFCEYLTEYHILPKSWYPKNTSQHIEKWVVPACRKCNNLFGRIEEDLLLKLGMCMEADDLFAIGINQKVSRMISPAEDYSKESYLRKRSALLKVLVDMKPCVGPHPCMLKYTNHWHGPRDGLMIRIPQKELSPFIKKITKGLEYKLRGKLVEVDRGIITYRPTQNNPEDDALFEKFEKRIASCLQTANCGHGFVVNYGVNPYNDGNVIYKVLIWGKLELWAQIIPNNMIKKR